MKDRKNIPTEQTWNLASIYANDAEWEADLLTLDPILNDLLQYRGKLGQGAEKLARAFQLRDDLGRKMNKIYVYAHLHADQDTTNAHYMGLQGRIQTKAVQIGAALSWMDPEILALSSTTIAEYSKAAALKPFARALELLLRQKPHTLSEKEENLLTQASDPLSSIHKAFGMLNNADMRFPNTKDDQGKSVELTHGNYIKFLDNPNRDVRKQAFEALFSAYGAHKHTFAAILEGQTKMHVFHARTKNFKSSLEASLFDDNVPKSVYDSLVATVRGHLPLFHRYIRLRKRLLQLDHLDMYDLYVPIVKDFKLNVPFETARGWITDAFKVMGEDYTKVVESAFRDRWIDVHESRGKRSGAYSSGCYDTMPFILMNYQDNLNSAFTLAHELGHSLHSYYSRKTQPHTTASYRIFVAEVASTTNEALLHHHLLKSTTDPKFRAYLLNHFCEEFRGTVFRQTMFAEFERMIHAKVEAGVSLTPDELCQAYYQLNADYYGPDVQADRRIELEWARIPHLYYGFYVYKYATGFSAAQAFSSRILAGDRKAIDAYQRFLCAGGSKDPLDILIDAGVDLRGPQPIVDALKNFEAAVTELEKLL
ncbi:MAG: oligoendopeptidase F [Bacteriovoracia bacterium]